MNLGRSITVRLFLASFVGFILLIANSLSNIVSIKAVHDSAREMRDVWNVKNRELDELQFLALRYHTTTIRRVIAEESAENRDLDTEFTEMDAAIPEKFRQYRFHIGSADETALWNAFEARWQAYLAAREPIVAALRRSDRNAGRDAIAPARTPLVNAFGALADLAKVNATGTQAATRRAEDAYATAWTVTAALLIAGLVATAGALWLILHGVARPIRAMTGIMARLAAQDLTVAVPHAARRDEIGAMAASVQVFKDGLIHAQALEAETARARADAEEQRKTGMRHIADAFEGSVGGIIGTVSGASAALQATAATMTTARPPAPPANPCGWRARPNWLPPTSTPRPPRRRNSKAPSRRSAVRCRAPRL